MATANPRVIQNGAFALFKDSLAQRILTIPGFASTPADITADDSDSLDDFVSFLASETWPIIPERLKNLSPPSTSSTSEREEVLAYVDSDEFSQMLDSTPMSFIDTLTSISAMEEDDVRDFLRRVISDYVSTALTPLPIWSKTRTKECEICEREVPLTYHHLIPRETHDKVKKRGWHPEEMLNSVAWLCRPCHSSVHRVATNEELAREYYTVERLLEREDIRKWRAYAAKQRFGVKRG